MLGSDQPHASAPAPVRGVHRVWDPRVWGTIIGAAGATAFVLANRGALTSPWPTVATLTWVVVFLAYVWFVFGAPRVFGEMAPLGWRAGITYLGSVVGMLVLIRLGTLLLDDASSVGLRPALIVVAVGLHFLPFAKAFHTPMFVTLGSLMTVLGATGLVLGRLWDERAAAASAVVTGIVMLVVIAGDAGWTNRRRG
jgi:hypothetical protein